MIPLCSGKLWQSTFVELIVESLREVMDAVKWLSFDRSVINPFAVFTG